MTNAKDVDAILDDLAAAGERAARQAAGVDGSDDQPEPAEPRPTAETDGAAGPAAPERAWVDPQVHELNAHLLFSGEALDNPMMPYLAMLSAWEPDMGGVTTFEAAGSRWHVGTHEYVPQAGEFTDDDRPSIARYWHGKIATREQDSGTHYIEFQVPVYDHEADGFERRINFQFRPALPEAEHVETGERINSLPAELPHGVRVEVGSANVDADDVLDVLQGLAEAMGVSQRYFDRGCIHPWSRLFGLAFYVRGLRSVIHEGLVGCGGLFERLGVFSPRHGGRGEKTWDNEGVYGKRHSVALDPEALAKLSGEHAVGKLLKSYLPKYADEEPGDDPLDHPKVEVQWSRYYTPPDVAVPWLPEHVDDVNGEAISRDTLAARLQSHLLNALLWGGIGLRPGEDHWIGDDHFQPAPMDAALANAIELRADPTTDVIDQERETVVTELVHKRPTDAERDVLDVIANGGVAAHRQQEIADEADVAQATVSRTVRKFDDLLSTAYGYAPASDVVGERIQAIFEAVERTIDVSKRGIERINGREDTIPTDSALAKWARRWGATLSDEGAALKLRLELGQLTRHELIAVLRSGYEAADRTPGILLDRFTSAEVAYHDAEGELVDRGERFIVYDGGTARILGRGRVPGSV